jgi:hypothetical protein
VKRVWEEILPEHYFVDVPRVSNGKGSVQQCSRIGPVSIVAAQRFDGTREDLAMVVVQRREFHCDAVE